jgi:hypothetical protein
MNKTIARLITAAMIAVLATTFFQVAHAYKVNCGDTLCNGSGMTNEGSYHYGYSHAKSQYECNSTPDASCMGGGELCSSEITAYVHNITSGYYVPEDLGHVSNQTACIDGYVNGWNKACSENGKIAREQHLDCPTDFFVEVHGFVANYDAGVRHLFVQYWTHNKPSSYQIKQGWWTDDVLQPALMDKTWNIVNESSNVTDMTGQSGTMTFNADHFTEHINGKTLQGIWSDSLNFEGKMWKKTSQGISLTILSPGNFLVGTANLYFKTGDLKNNIEFTDDHNNTIHLMR